MVGSNPENWPGVLGHQGEGKSLLTFCENHSLTITSTVFKQKGHHNVTWMHSLSKHWRLLDYVNTKQHDRKEPIDQQT